MHQVVDRVEDRIAGHVLRILAARWLGLPPIAGRLFALEPARLSALGFEHDQPVIDCWNAPARAAGSGVGNVRG